MASMAPAADAATRVTFTFPGQGSYSYAVLRELYTSYPQTVPYFNQANDIGREILQRDFLSLVTATSAKEHDERLREGPDLDQIGIYLIEALIAKILIESGAKPALLVGHSFGELAALAAGEVYSIETGLRIVCQRVLALQSVANSGVMAAISCDCERARQFIEELGNNSIEISVINHQRQTVLSGRLSELERLSTIVNPFGVSVTILSSKYPYHSSLLRRAVAPFRTALQSYDFRPASIPVYLCMKGMLYSPGSDLAEILSSQFVHTLRFSDVVKTLYHSGYRTFVECGAGNIVTKLIQQNLPEPANSVVALPTATMAGGLQEGMAKVFDLGLGKREPTLVPGGTGETKPKSQDRAQLLHTMSLVVKGMSQLVETTSHLVEQVSRSLAAEPPDSSLAETTSPPPRASLVTSVSSLPEVAPAADSVPKHSIAEQKDSPPDTRQIMIATSDRDGGKRSSTQPDLDKQALFAREACTETPVAIVSIGCVLPGANDPERYWSNILNGVSGISNLADVDPSAAHDFLAGNDGDQVKIVPDKTYTLLHGSIVSIPYDTALLSNAYDKEEFELLTRGQRLLALAVAQSLSRLRVPINRSGSAGMRCILGGTADGSKEYDDALFLENLEALLATIGEPEGLRLSFAETIEDISGYQNGDSEKLAQHKIYPSVVARLLGGGIPTYVVDTACSSSLYSTYLGMKALQDRDCDVVLAGGVFAPGPANNTLFAQFKGLARRESRPFDASADGVIFGDGAGIAILKRLPDALDHGDRILAVIRGMGLSSDGKSPSINVPQVKGQGLAIRNAYKHSAIDVNTIQYVEAHATATLVGDAVEFNALNGMMKRDRSFPPIELGSVKALIGHTGWAAGVASLIKICKAFEARVIPKQYHYVGPGPEIDLAHSQFTIPEISHSWPDNVAPYPRRAAINGFGFGGTNAHLILEDFDEPYHRNLCAHFSIQDKIPMSLAVIGIGSLFPGVDGALADEPTAKARFRRESLHLPGKKMLLPDVTDHMDGSQYLAALAAEKTFATMPEGWSRFRNAMGVVLGLESKTERGMRANERIFADRLRRQVMERGGRGKLSNADLNRILDKLVELIRGRNVPSGPYTLPGLMPNVTASRIANMFDMNGPNIVVDMGDNSLLQSLSVARQLLAHGNCQIVLAGGINANNASDETQAEAVLLLALTTPEIARRESWPVLINMRMFEREEGAHGRQATSDVNPTRNFRGAHGAPEILRAIHRARELSLPTEFRQRGKGSMAGRRLVFTPPSYPEISSPAQPETRTYAYVQDTPIRYYTPQLVPAEAEGEAKTLKGHNILFVTDQPDKWLALEESGALRAFEYHVVCPLDARLAKSLPVDLTSEESIRSSLSDLANLQFDTLVAIRSLDNHAKDALLLSSSKSELDWIELLFTVCRQSYERILKENVPVIAVCQGAYSNAQLNPYTGLISGFMKSLSRELAGPMCRVINTDEVDLYKTLRQVEIEMGHPAGEVEVCYRNGTRNIFTLGPLGQLARDDQPYLDSHSVVIATGGARGVTAVLVEELLSRFGCRVIALGRTDPSTVPEEILRMSERDLQNYEAQFYKDELARNKARRITDLKREYLAYQAANEVRRVTERLQSISGNYEYHSLDITSESAIDEVVEASYRKYGRVDLVLHGAGIQVSTALTKKSLSDFRRIIATKLGGLSYLYKACQKYGKGHRTHFHLLTSAFSYMGNDGQPDYGAANEAMGRIAACMNSPDTGTHWSSMAWLGWAGVGMTRGTEYAALAATRHLRGVTHIEGRRIFGEAMTGSPASPVNILLAEGEVAYYRPGIRKEAVPTTGAPAIQPQSEGVVEWPVDPEAMPFLSDHLVRGAPTVPGSFIIAMAADAAHKLAPGLKIVQFERTRFLRLVRAYEGRPGHVRAMSKVVERGRDETVVQVQILMDFVHKSGRVLGKDLLHTEIYVRMGSTVREPSESTVYADEVAGVRIPDPYVMEGSPVRLNGAFRNMKEVVVGRTSRRAEYNLNGHSRYDSAFDYLIPNVILVDAFWRFGTVRTGESGGLSVYVPERCDAMKVFFDYADFGANLLRNPVTFHGANPRAEGDVLHVGPIDALDSNGRVFLRVEGGICRKFGEIEVH